MSDATDVLKAIGTLLPTPPPGTPSPFVLSEDGKIESSCDEVGLKIINKEMVVCPLFYRRLIDGIRSFMSTGPAAAAIGNSSREAVEQVIAESLRPFRVPNGYYFLQNRFLFFIASK